MTVCPCRLLRRRRGGLVQSNPTVSLRRRRQGRPRGPPFLTFAAIAERCGSPRPACGERVTRTERKPEFGPVRGRFHTLRLADDAPHPLHLPPGVGEGGRELAGGCAENAAHKKPSQDPDKSQFVCEAVMHK